MQKRRFTDPIVWTHALFLINAYLWHGAGSSVCAVLMLVSAFFSTMYHRNAEQPGFWQETDRGAASLTLLVTLIFALPVASGLMVLNAFLLLGAALLVKTLAIRTEKYRLWHSLWHFMVAVGQAYLAWVYAAGNAISG